MTATEQRIHLFEHAPVRSAVWKQILPAIASQMIALIYNLADTYFVGQLNDPVQTAAVTVSMPAFVMLTAISNLLGVGGASCIAQALGKRDLKQTGQISGVSFYGGLLLSGVFSLLVLVFARPILHLCGADARTYDVAYSYVKWVVIIGGPATSMSLLLANLVRAEGSAMVASLGMSLGGVLNIALDPFFVLPRFLNMGAMGAGIATALSNLVSVVFFVVYIVARRKHTVLRLGLVRAREGMPLLPRICSVGFPSAVQYTLTVVAAAVLTKFVSFYDAEAVAAFGIVKKLDMLPLFFSIGVANGLLPLLAYNYSAGNLEREHRAFRLGCGISLGFALLCLVAYELFAPTLTGLFIEETRTRTYAAAFLRIMVTAMPMMSVCYPMIIRLQATGKVKQALLCSVARKGVLDIPLLFLLDALIPLYGCMMVQPIVDTVSLGIALACSRRKL